KGLELMRNLQTQRSDGTWARIRLRVTCPCGFGQRPHRCRPGPGATADLVSDGALLPAKMAPLPFTRNRRGTDHGLQRPAVALVPGPPHRVTVHVHRIDNCPSRPP